MAVNERHHHLRLPPCSAWAKKTAALRRISFARLSSRFSRSNSFSRWRSSELTPALTIASSSARRTYFSTSPASSQSSMPPKQSLTTGMHAPARSSEPIEPLALALPGNISLVCSSAEPLKRFGLRQTRGSSRAGPAFCHAAESGGAGQPCMGVSGCVRRGCGTPGPDGQATKATEETELSFLYADQRVAAPVRRCTRGLPPMAARKTPQFAPRSYPCSPPFPVHCWHDRKKMGRRQQDKGLTRT